MGLKKINTFCVPTAKKVAARNLFSLGWSVEKKKKQINSKVLVSSASLKQGLELSKISILGSGIQVKGTSSEPGDWEGALVIVLPAPTHHPPTCMGRLPG